MRSILVALVLSAVTAFGCSVPDGDDLDSFAGQIGTLSPMASFEARRAEARSRAISDLESMDPDDILGDADCRDMHGGVRHPIPVREVLECLKANEINTIYPCIDSLVDRIANKYITQGTINPGSRCGFSWRGKVDPNPKWDMSEITDDDLARSAIDSDDEPPAWMIAAGIIGVGAAGAFFILMPEFLPALCLLAKDDSHWSCPGSPEYPPGETPEPSDEGDR